MKIGIISDTHDDVGNTKKAIEVFKKEKIDFIVHLGDYISPPIVRLFDGLKLVGIFGNNDGYKFVLSKAFGEIKGEIKGDFGIIEADGCKIALYHGEFAEISEALAKSKEYDAVFTGHWHKTKIEKIGSTVFLSIGSAKKEFAENSKPVIGIFETSTRKVRIINLEE